MNEAVIIVAGGKGTRMGTAIPKQFMLLHHKPVMVHTMERFRAYNPAIEIMVVMHADFVGYWNELINSLAIAIPHKIEVGGEERFHSVRNGLLALSLTNGVVGVHDAVRPMVSIQTIQACYHTAKERGNAVPVIPITDTLREVKEAESKTVDRNAFRIVQTPQCFHIDLLRKAYHQPYRAGFTDDASVVEALGEEIHLVQGNRENIKITTPEDARMADFLLK
jgi:2-C-methyl-D-erythritol 4-phosphate cytidylyltransferase